MRVLGPVDVVGAVRPFRRAWTLELVVYLALHPAGTSHETWSTALWPDRLPAPPTLHSTVSAARRALGRGRSGIDHLPHGHGRIRLAETVTSDWCRFRRLAASGRPAERRDALALVRGRPFEGLRSPDWTVLEGFSAEIEDAVGRLAAELAEEELDRHRPRVATATARRGLRASPYDERLYRALMRAADQEGHPGGVLSVLSELAAVLGAEPGGLPVPVEGGVWGHLVRAVHPATAELARSLLGCRGRGGKVVADERGRRAGAIGGRLPTL